jgi:hypothetical protein
VTVVPPLPRRWSLLATALAGRPLAVRVVPAVGRVWDHSAQPEVVDLPLGGSDDAWRLAVLRHAMDLMNDGRFAFRLDRAAALGLAGSAGATPPPSASEVERCLAGWPRPVLLRRLWWRLDRQRVDARIRQRFPGARAALPAGPGWPVGLPPALQAALQCGTTATATVDDSLRAALAWCAWLSAGHPGRPRRRPGAAWMVNELDAAEQGDPAGARGTGRGRADGGRDAEPADRRHGDGTASRPAEAPAGPASGAALSGPTAPRADRPAVVPTLPASTRAMPTQPTLQDAQRHRHDEWDYRLQRYRRAWTCVHERVLPPADPAFLADLRQRHPGLARLIRRRFSGTRPAWRERVRRAPEGDQPDLDAAIAELADRRAGHVPEGRVYVAHPPRRRDVCAALLLDTSGSTGFALPDPVADAAEASDAEEDFFFHAAPRRHGPPPRPRRRVIDVARDAIGLMCEGLHGLGDRHAVFGFTGQGREQVDFAVAKGFDSAWDARGAAPLAALQPGGSTRTGAAIRHALRHLAREPARRKVLIVVTDGYPQDSDYGPDPDDLDYGLHDTARALHEAARAGVAAFCISVDGAAHDHLRRVCPPQRYLVIDDVNDLPQRLVAVYRRLTTG